MKKINTWTDNTQTDNTKQIYYTSPEPRKAHCDFARVLDLLKKKQ